MELTQQQRSCSTHSIPTTSTQRTYKKRETSVNDTYTERAALILPIAEQLESIAHRLRQGAISDELASTKLHLIAVQLIEET